MPQEGLREMATKHLFGNSKSRPKLRKAAEGIGIQDPSVFQGSALLQALLAQLGGQAETFAVGVPGVQQGLFGLLGSIFPGMYGLTDPAEQRRQMGAPQFYRGGGGTYMQDPEGQFRRVMGQGVLKALGGSEANLMDVGAPFMQGMGQLGAPIYSADIPSVMAAFRQPTLAGKQFGLAEQQFGLQQQQARTQRELRGLSGVPGAGQIPGFGI